MFFRITALECIVHQSHHATDAVAVPAGVCRWTAKLAPTECRGEWTKKSLSKLTVNMVYLECAIVSLRKRHPQCMNVNKRNAIGVAYLHTRIGPNAEHQLR